MGLRRFSLQAALGALASRTGWMSSTGESGSERKRRKRRVEQAALFFTQKVGLVRHVC